MTFAPILLGQGLNGWRYVQKTHDAQVARLSRTPETARDETYLADTLKTVTSAESLTRDHRLLRVILEAYGLQEDLNSQYFIRKIMEGGVQSQSALANKLADERYRNLARDFDFSNPSRPPAFDQDFISKVTSMRRAALFESAVGEQDESLRLALNFQRGIRQIADGAHTNTAAWFRVLGNPPLRKVLEQAFGLPAEFAQLDVDTQLQRLTSKASAAFGTSELTRLANDDLLDQITTRFIARSQVANSQLSSSNQIALQLLNSLDRSDGR